MTLDEYLKQVRGQADAMIHFQTKAGQPVEEGPYPDVLRLLAIIEAQRAEMNRLFDALQGSGLLMGLAGNALVGTRFEKGEL